MLKHVLIICFLFSFSSLICQQKSEAGFDSTKIKNKWKSIGKVNFYSPLGVGYFIDHQPNINTANYNGYYLSDHYFYYGTGFNATIFEKGRFAVQVGFELEVFYESATVGYTHFNSSYSVSNTKVFIGIPLTASIRLNSLNSPYYVGVRAGALLGLDLGANSSNGGVPGYDGSTLGVPILFQNFSIEPFGKMLFTVGDGWYGATGIKLGYVIR